VPYRFVATATPSPNRYKELIHYAGFLGVMDTGLALTRWFQRDSTKANNLTLYPHKEAEFWRWLSTWSVWLQSPADLGCDATGYTLPDLRVEWHEVDVDHTNTTVNRDGQAHLFRGGALGVKDIAREKRDSLPARIDEAMRIVDSYLQVDPTDQVIVWVDLNDEQDAVENALTARGVLFSSVHGALTTEECERRIADWRARRTTALIGKPVQLGQGLNLQQCNKAVFVGVTYKFNDTIQACHRIQRFGQKHTCRVHIIHAESEREVVRALNAKWAQHEELTTTMTNLIREHGLSAASVTDTLARSIGVKRVEETGNGWLVAHNDCVVETRAMDTTTVDLIVTSIPFSNHYEYTPSVNDFGHTDDNAHFWAQMDYLTPELLRVLNPGRLYCCHVKDRILFGSVTGAGVPTVSPFHAEAIMHGRKHGFDYLGMITVVTDVVRENNQTYRLGWTENSKDSTKMGVGSPEYILLFRKPQTDRTKGYADLPVAKDKTVYTRARWQVDAHAFWRSDGNRHLTPDELATLPADQMSALFTDQTLHAIYDYDSHVTTGEALEARGSLPATFMSLAPGSWHPDVWTDINRMDTLNTEQSRRAQEQHICPLQLGLIKRLITRYSNPHELVYDPFGGLSSVAYVAVQEGRRGRTCELNPDYFQHGAAYLRELDRKNSAPTLFDLMEFEEQVAS
jgi:DNA modification methylase